MFNITTMRSIVKIELPCLTIGAHRDVQFILSYIKKIPLLYLNRS
jgi:hypothetical protein